MRRDFILEGDAFEEIKGVNHCALMEISRFKARFGNFWSVSRRNFVGVWSDIRQDRNTDELCFLQSESGACDEYSFAKLVEMDAGVC